MGRTRFIPPPSRLPVGCITSRLRLYGVCYTAFVLRQLVDAKASGAGGSESFQVKAITHEGGGRRAKRACNILSLQTQQPAPPPPPAHSLTRFLDVFDSFRLPPPPCNSWRRPPTASTTADHLHPVHPGEEEEKQQDFSQGSTAAAATRSTLLSAPAACSRQTRSTFAAPRAWWR